MIMLFMGWCGNIGRRVRLLAISSFVMFFSCAVLADLTPDQLHAKERGVFLYQMMQFEDAIPFLEIAARAGDRDSQYRIGNIRDQQDYRMASEAQYWYELASYQDHIPAMIKLTKVDNRICRIMQNCRASTKRPEEWREIALRLSRQRARLGDGSAMFYLYVLTREFHWLRKSARAGFPHGQYMLANEYAQGKGFFLFHGKRQKAIDKWLVASAEAGSLPAMELLVRKYAARKDYQALYVWLERAAVAGSPRSLLNYSALLAHLRDDFRLPLDLVKAYGLALVASKYPHVQYEKLAYKQLADIAGKMNGQDLESGITYAEQWVRFVPAISGQDMYYGRGFLTLP